MKNGTAIFVFIFGLLSSDGVWAAEKTVTLDVENMSCALCSLTVHKALKAVEGVQTVKVSLADHTAMISFDDERADIATLTAATTKAGFPSRVGEKGLE